MYAYNLQNYQLSQSNSKGDDVYYDIEAKAEGDAAPTKDQFHKWSSRCWRKDSNLLRSITKCATLRSTSWSSERTARKLKPSAADATTSGNIGVKEAQPDHYSFEIDSGRACPDVLPLYARASGD